MLSMVKASNNPQQLFNSMLSNNPQMQNVMQYVNQHGGDPRQAFYSLAKEKGVDPNQILGMLSDKK